MGKQFWVQNICYSCALKFDLTINLENFLLNAKCILLIVKMELIAFNTLLKYFWSTFIVLEHGERWPPLTILSFLSQKRKFYWDSWSELIWIFVCSWVTYSHISLWGFWLLKIFLENRTDKILLTEKNKGIRINWVSHVPIFNRFLGTMGLPWYQLYNISPFIRVESVTAAHAWCLS